MILPARALEKILKEIRPLKSELVSLENAQGRVLAQDVRAASDQPPFDTTAVDGYAVRVRDAAAASTRSPKVLFVKEVLRAGAMARARLMAGEAFQIMTGAPMPKGADAVVMKEITAPHANGHVQILRAPVLGDFIRRRGEDIRTGELLLSKGALIRPLEVALLAAQGVLKIPVFRKPRVAVVSTGDELLEIHEPLAPGKIRNSNGASLTAGLGRWGIVPQYAATVKDKPALIKAALQRALKRSDVLLVSGGVSVGEFDYTKDVLEKLGLKVRFWKVAMKPGKPLLFGRVGEKLVFGLPGNPVSVLVCLEEFVKPALDGMQGLAPRFSRYHLEGTVENKFEKDPAKQHYLFCRAAESSKGFSLHVLKPQGSHMMKAACKADALALGPIGLSLIKPGTKLKFRWL